MGVIGLTLFVGSPLISVLCFIAVEFSYRKWMGQENMDFRLGFRPPKASIFSGLLFGSAISTIFMGIYIGQVVSTGEAFIMTFTLSFIIGLTILVVLAIPYAALFYSWGWYRKIHILTAPSLIVAPLLSPLCFVQQINLEKNMLAMFAIGTAAYTTALYFKIPEKSN